MPAPPAKATFMASSVPSMMQEIRVVKNDYLQRFGAGKCIFLCFLHACCGVAQKHSFSSYMNIVLFIIL